MIAATHVGFALSIALMANTEVTSMIAMAAGSILPDIDHPQSSIGRVFYPISKRIHRHFGHRTMTHSLIFWLPFLLIAYPLSKMAFFVGIGAVTHAILDTANISGVALFYPITDKICVFGSRRLRIGSGSREEWMVLMCLFLICIGLFYVWNNGGVMKMIADGIGSYETVKSRYKKTGLKKSYVIGKLRYFDGLIEESEWLIVGMQKNGDMAIYDHIKKDVIQIPTDAEFLKAKLSTTDQTWSYLNINELSQIHAMKGFVFSLSAQQWIHMEEGDYIVGTIIYDQWLDLRRADE